jgi:hydrogenase 3 maturation protease
MTDVVLTVGNTMMGDDAAGPMLAARLRNAPAPGWEAVDGGSAPENVMHRVRALAPERVLVVDATDMGLAPGEIRRVDDRFIAENFIMTTHDMPVSYLIASLRESVAQVHFLGIQPAVVAFGYPVSPEVARSIEAIHRHLRANDAIDAWPAL